MKFAAVKHDGRMKYHFSDDVVAWMGIGLMLLENDWKTEKKEKGDLAIVSRMFDSTRGRVKRVDGIWIKIR